MNCALLPVVSSQIAAIGYDDETFQLFAQFPGGTIYRYDGVEPDTHERVMTSESIGSAFNEFIKGRDRNNPPYPYEKLESAPVESKEAPAEEIEELPDEDAELKTRALAVKTAIAGLIILTSDAYSKAADKLKSLVAERKLVQARVDKVKGPAYQTYKATLDLEKEAIGPYDEAEKILKRGMSGYLQQEADEKRKREAELNRIAHENAVAEAAERSRRIAEQDASVAASQGDHALAASIIANPLPVAPIKAPPVVLQTTTPKVAGVSKRTNWKWRVIDIKLVPDQYKSIDEVKINGVVRSLKETANIPGIEVYSEDSISVKA